MLGSTTVVLTYIPLRYLGGSVLFFVETFGMEILTKLIYYFWVVVSNIVYFYPYWEVIQFD